MSGTGRQLDLPLGRQVDQQRPIKAAVARALKSCGLSREQVADRINAALEADGSPYRLAAATLDRWAAPSDTSHNIPAWLVVAFCRATTSRELVELQAEGLGLSLVGERERHLIALGEAQMQSTRLAKQRKRALEALEGMS
jgi:hypothetical protein